MESLLGIDIGGTNTKIGIVACEEPVRVLVQRSIPTHVDDAPEKIVRRIADAAQQLIEGAGAAVAGVGVGCPGLIVPSSGTVLKSPNLPTFEGFHLRDSLKELLRLPIELQNDANAAVLGEFLFGPSKGVQNLILLTLGTGLGGGVVADGKLLQGADNAAAELGHLKIEPDGALCGCGHRGCLEAYVGAAGIARIAREMLASDTKTSLKPEFLTTKDITAAAVAGDALARDVLRKVGRYLGRGIALLIDVFNPEKVLLGGGASAAFDFLRPGVDEAVHEYASFTATRDRTIIDKAAFPDDINVLGAAATFLNAHPCVVKAPDRAEAPVPPIVHVGDGRFVLGIHIGASSYHVGLLRTSGEVVAKAEGREPSDRRRNKRYAELLQEAVANSAQVIQQAMAQGVARDQILGAGVVVPVPVDADNGGYVVRAPALPHLQNVFLGHDLKASLKVKCGLDLPFWVDNDANGACLAEWYFGAAQGHQHFFTGLLCTGLGSGMILNGQLYRGAKNWAGEFGHMTVQPDGIRCNCGNRGCLETLASGWALLNAVRARDLPLGRQPDLHYADLIRIAEEGAAGSGEVLEVFKHMGTYLGIGLASIINVLNPSLVVLSGHLSQAHSFFLPAANEKLRCRVFAGLGCDVLPAANRGDTEIRSALSTFLYYRRRPA